MKDYYEKHHKTYFERTVLIDPVLFLKPFADVLPSGSSVLDVGCGSGRDLLWLKQRGFAAAGLERSPGLAALARTHSGCPVIEGDFMTFEFDEPAFDALLLCGALVHLPHAQTPVVLDRLLQALNRPGWVFLSMKAGRGQRIDPAGRTFYLWSAEDLEKILASLRLEILSVSRTVSAAGTGEYWLGYVLAQGIPGPGAKTK